MPKYTDKDNFKILDHYANFEGVNYPVYKTFLPSGMYDPNLYYDQ